MAPSKDSKRGSKPPESSINNSITSNSNGGGGNTSRESRHTGLFLPLFGLRLSPRHKRRPVETDRDRLTSDHERHSHLRRGRAPPPVPTVDVELKPLDDRQPNMKFSLQSNSAVAKLEHLIRRRYQDKGHPIATAAHFAFYVDGKLLNPEDLLRPSASSKIWYRMSRSAAEADQWKFSQYADAKNQPISPELATQLVQAIDTGATVGELRRKIATFMDIPDPDRVLLVARGGTRPGQLQGDSWVVSEVKQHWLCCWISYHIAKTNAYAVINGLGRRYVYHPEAHYFFDGMSVRRWQHHLDTRLFRNVRSRGKTGFNSHWSELILTLHGIRVSKTTRVCWGKTYELELPNQAAKIFSTEEAWLLPDDTCSVCLDSKNLSLMAYKITPGCNHKPTVCNACLGHWITSELETKMWDRIKCPECPKPLEFAYVRRNAPRSVFKRYDELATRAALGNIPNFRWCKSAKCNSGQIDDVKCVRFKCKACRASHCIKHDVPWHSGETCEEYDKRNTQKKRDEKASEAEITKSSKKCPSCNKAVHKFSGCNHITCICSHEWCYICLAPFQRNEHGFLYCRHNPECTERDPFVDLIDPQNANADPRRVFEVAHGLFPPQFLRNRLRVVRGRAARQNMGVGVNEPGPEPIGHNHNHLHQELFPWLQEPEHGMFAGVAGIADHVANGNGNGRDPMHDLGLFARDMRAARRERA
ncbi:hypothetical protein B0T20DRAFT_86585 [Sordaria brevicollis]|uniref:RBR-type E3 ubiquitin transferase n=1 Tax=Sordaria brevicollis TaxID=83679 RepID=A0AAE0U2U0_SORBR|nr:hypothetical protein B0T20DRAFT_86585 [Sordaria brevicollis]